MNNWAAITGAAIVAAAITVASHQRLEADRFDVQAGPQGILRYDHRTGELASLGRAGRDQPLTWIAVSSPGREAALSAEAVRLIQQGDWSFVPDPFQPAYGSTAGR